MKWFWWFGEDLVRLFWWYFSAWFWLFSGRSYSIFVCDVLVFFCYFEIIFIGHGGHLCAGYSGFLVYEEEEAGK